MFVKFSSAGSVAVVLEMLNPWTIEPWAVVEQKAERVACAKGCAAWRARRWACMGA